MNGRDVVWRWGMKLKKRRGRERQGEKSREAKIKREPTTANCRYGRVDPTS
jgi:hypothetical protein